jgi:hypothetical protein
MLHFEPLNIPHATFELGALQTQARVITRKAISPRRQDLGISNGANRASTARLCF